MIIIKPILFLVLIYLVPIKNLKQIYTFDNEKFKIAKIINLIVTIVIFYVLLSDSGFYLLFTDFKKFKEIYQIDTGLINSTINFISKILSNITQFFLFVIVFGLSRRIKKDRKRLLILLPILTLLSTIQLNRQSYVMNEQLYNEKFNLFFAFIWSSIKFSILFFIYNSKAFKNMMSLDYKKIKEIKTGSA